MKQQIGLSVIILVFLSLLGCAQRTEGELVSSIYSEENLISMDTIAELATEVSPKRNKVSYEISNRSSNLLEVGDEAILEVLVNGSWYRIKHSEGWVSTQMLYYIEPGQTHTFMYRLDSHGLSKLPTGIYRLVLDTYWKDQRVYLPFTVD